MPCKTKRLKAIPPKILWQRNIIIAFLDRFTLNDL